MIRTSLMIALVACGDKDAETDEAVDSKDWLSADLAELSSGECPDMSTSGDTVSFLSSGEERTVTIVFPNSPEDGMRIIFFYHGLLEADSNPTNYMATALDFQTMADEYNSIIILPESPIWDLMGQRFHMWDVIDGTFDKDVTFFDDLRTCVANEFDVDLDKLISSGFSGGSLFNTILLSQRADTLAAVVEMSGGADIEVPLYEDEFAPYSSPSTNVPVLLVSGGSSDLWPDASFTLVNFEEATNTLQQRLLADQQFVVRCKHNAGHTITNKAYSTAIDWIVNHEYGVESPYQSDIGSWSDWCEIP